jgi:lipopolysaccharide/colanic/teichoic acid biosynthesis glycosyltransferase
MWMSFRSLGTCLGAEMGIVGTHALAAEDTAAYGEHHHWRLSMKPGVTGLWQLNGNGAISNFEDVVKLDGEYIDNWSLQIDFKIMAKTIAKMIRGDGW